jgi:hypothetical protein
VVADLRAGRTEKPADFPILRGPSSNWSSACKPLRHWTSTFPPTLLGRADEVIE